MIRQQIGDLLEIKFDGKYYYVVVLTKIVMFGGNIVFAFHTDGGRKDFDDLSHKLDGFNICTDLLLPKKEGVVERIHKFENLDQFWKTKYVKATSEHRPGYKAKKWWLSHVDDLRNYVGTYRRLPKRFRSAMDSGTFSFDLTAKKILSQYTPDQNVFL